MLAGFLLGATVTSIEGPLVRPRGGRDEARTTTTNEGGHVGIDPRVPAALRPPSPPTPGIDPDSMCVRELRALPGIGATRALADVRARFERGLRGGPAAWDRLPGIGDKTIEGVERALERARAARLSAPTRGAYTSAGNRP